MTRSLYLGKYRNGTNRRPRWNYASPSPYFVTICTLNRAPWFGTVRNGFMELSDVGSIIAKEWTRMGTLRPNIVLDEWIVMPDHLHGIIRICPRHASAQWDDVRAPLNGAPMRMAMGIAQSHCADASAPSQSRNPHHLPNWNPGALGPIIQQFKRACTIRILATGHDDFAWQPRYHDHIIRNAAEAERIRAYIRRNPAQWPYARH